MALRLPFKRWYPLIFLITSGVVIASWHWLGKSQRPELLLSCIGATGGFSYFIYRQHLDETKLFKELFVEFNKRYEELSPRLNEIRVGPSEGELSKTEEDMLFRYFNLCAEEYLFYRAGYIDQDVWNSWCHGMGVFFAQPRIRNLWDADSKANSYYGFRPSCRL